MPSERDRRRLPVFFYSTEAGKEPIREWLKQLDPMDRNTLGTSLLRVQEQWPIGMPVCRSLGKSLWEVRADLSRNRTARILFFLYEGQIGVVHGFIKKTRTTPQIELELARKRMKEMKR